MKSIEKIEAKKSLGQHFLNNAHVPKAMADAGEVREGDIVLEIGPGTGILTQELLKRGATVIALEADQRAIEALRTTFDDEIMAQKLSIMHGDARTIDLRALGLRPRAFKVVANIPYYLSGLLFRTFLETDIQPSTLVFLVQREVALRIARDKKESLLSLSVKVFGEPTYVKTVGKGNFTPQPKVDSAIIAVKNIGKERLLDIPEDFFFSVLHEAFKSKRKQLLGNLKGIFDETMLTHSMEAHHIHEKARAEDIPITSWIPFIQDLFFHKTRTS